MKYFSMFSGIGGFELGIQRANICDRDGETEKGYGKTTSSFKVLQECEQSMALRGSYANSNNRQKTVCVGYSEVDKYAVKTYEKNFRGHKNYGNATKIEPSELPDFDLLCGGFPCQAFSIAGKRRGFEDTRGTLFFDIARILKVKRPKTLLLENVKGLLSHNKGKTFRIICETLNSLGYLINYEVINSKNFGVPQNRERVFIKGWHINAIVEDGKTEKKSLLKRTILDYLFQLFLQNLKEVKKLQEHKSKDWVLGYLILKEIKRNQKFKELVKTKDGVMILTEENKLESRAEVMWQNIDLLLKEILGESYLELSKSTTLTATKQTTELKTYTYSELLMSMLVVTTAFRNSSKNLWKEILSFLIVIKEGTKYARIIEKTKERVWTEHFTSYESRILQDAERVFIIGSLRGTSRPEILPIGERNTEVNEQGTIHPSSCQGRWEWSTSCDNSFPLS